MAEEAPSTPDTVHSCQWHTDHHGRISSSPHLDEFVFPATRRIQWCDLDRPVFPEDVPRVRLTGTGEGGVITIGDWVACVHARLGQYHEELQARGMWHAEGSESDVRPDEIMYVDQSADVRYVTLQGERDMDISGWEG